MTISELECAIRKIICETYCTKYCGLLKVNIVKDCFCDKCCERSDGLEIGYELVLGMNNNMRPIRIAFNGTEELFLDYIKKEIRNRKLNLAKYSTGYYIYRAEDCEEYTIPKPLNCC